MTVIDKLASSLGRRDEIPNQELAKQIAGAGDKKAVKELVENLANKNKNIQNDCIKTLYEVGNLKPSLITMYASTFIQLLDHKNNRLQWGAMTALNSIAIYVPKIVFAALPKLAAIADKGTVITRDNFVGMLTKLCPVKEYADDVFSLLNEQLLTCPPNQLPMYAENAIAVISEKNRAIFTKTLVSRISDFEKESKRRRIEKLLKKLQSK